MQEKKLELIPKRLPYESLPETKLSALSESISPVPLGKRLLHGAVMSAKRIVGRA
jgi:hypothetical protein